MLVEERALASGVLLKEMRQGDWQYAYKHPTRFELSRESFILRRSLNLTQVVIAGICWKLLFDMCLKVNPVGKPDAVAPHVRFDERGWETEPMCHRAHPRLYWLVDTIQIR